MAPRWTPLHVASWYGHLHVVRLLCQAAEAVEIHIDLRSGEAWGFRCILCFCMGDNMG